ATVRRRFYHTIGRHRVVRRCVPSMTSLAVRRAPMSRRIFCVCYLVGVACLVVGSLLLHDRGRAHAARPTEMRAGADATPQLVLEAGGRQVLVRTLLFTANGQALVSVSDDKTIRVWSVSLDGRQATLARTLCGQMEEGRVGMLATAALSPPDAMGQQRWLAV